MVSQNNPVMLNKLAFSFPSVTVGYDFLKQYLPVQYHQSLKGRYAYKHHSVLYDSESIMLGEFCWGGNGGSMHIRLNEDGCENLLAKVSLPELYPMLLSASISRLNNIELYVDDFIGAFTCQHAVAAAYDDAFYREMGPKSTPHYYCIKDINDVVRKEYVTVGSTQSFISWRISNKAIAYQIPILWNRSLAILNDVSIGILLNIEGSFAGICRYSASMINAVPDKQYLIPA